MKYSMRFRSAAVRKTQDGSGRNAYQVAKELGVCPATIASWIKQYQNGTLTLDETDAVTPNQRSPGEKLALLLEAKGLPEDQLGDWIRQQGLHSEHLSLWEQELTTLMTDKKASLNDENKILRKENKNLQAELDRKTKALAEAAVLLTLKKNYRHLFANEEDVGVEY